MAKANSLFFSTLFPRISLGVDKMTENVKNDNPIFFDLYRKEGFRKVLIALSRSPEGCNPHQLSLECGYYNKFLRVRQDMVKYKIICYFLDDQNKKKAKLTDFGMTVAAKMMELEQLLQDEK